MTKWEAYTICLIRGHDPSDVVLTVNPPLSVCKWCGTHYRFDQPNLVESNVPTPPNF